MGIGILVLSAYFFIFNILHIASRTWGQFWSEAKKAPGFLKFYFTLIWFLLHSAKSHWSSETRNFCLVSLILFPSESPPVMLHRHDLWQALGFFCHVLKTKRNLAANLFYKLEYDLLLEFAVWSYTTTREEGGEAWNGFCSRQYHSLLGDTAISAQTSCSLGEAIQLLKQKGGDSLGGCLNYRFLKSPVDMYLGVDLHKMFMWSWWTDFIIGLMSSQRVFKAFTS